MKQKTLRDNLELKNGITDAGSLDLGFASNDEGDRARGGTEDRELVVEHHVNYD